MQQNVAVPRNRVKRGRPAYVATGARRVVTDAFEVGPVAERGGAAGWAVVSGIASVQGVGKCSPLEWMYRSFVTEMALGLGAGNFRNAPQEIRPVALRARLGVFICRCLVTSRQPGCGMFA